MPQFTEILVRNEGGAIANIAIVKGFATSTLAVSDPIGAISQAVTDWVETSSEGAAAWTQSHLDFNIGDLIHYLGEETLKNCLKDKGIDRLDIDTFGEVNSRYTFDSVLVIEKLR